MYLITSILSLCFTRLGGDFHAPLQRVRTFCRCWYSYQIWALLFTETTCEGLSRYFTIMAWRLGFLFHFDNRGPRLKPKPELHVHGPSPMDLTHLIMFQNSIEYIERACEWFSWEWQRGVTSKRDHGLFIQVLSSFFTC